MTAECFQLHVIPAGFGLKVSSSFLALASQFWGNDFPVGVGGISPIYNLSAFFTYVVALESNRTFGFRCVVDAITEARGMCLCLAHGVPEHTVAVR